MTHTTAPFFRTREEAQSFADQANKRHAEKGNGFFTEVHKLKNAFPLGRYLMRFETRTIHKETK